MDYQNSLEIILHAGNAKTFILDAMDEAEKGNYEVADELLEKAKQEMLAAHEQHQSLLVQLANGEKVEVDLMMVHAEDHLSSAADQILLVRQFMKVYKRLEDIQK